MESKLRDALQYVQQEADKLLTIPSLRCRLRASPSAEVILPHASAKGVDALPYPRIDV